MPTTTYQHSFEAQPFPHLQVTDAIIKEQLAKQNKNSPIKAMFETSNWKKKKVLFYIGFTVRWGLIFATSKTFSNASSDGLQTIGVLGSSRSELGWCRYLPTSNIPFLPNSVSALSTQVLSLRVGFKVSKDMISWKQSSNPSLLSALAAWALSAFVKTCPQLSKSHEKNL